jgi:PAS domain S-box-containing protein
MASTRQGKALMSLRVKTFAILVVVLLSYTALSYLVQRLVILPSFNALEQEAARKDVLRCVKALHREVQEIDGIVRDWANWDETYKFIQDRKRDYIKASLTLSSYKNIRMNLIYLLDTEGRVVWGEIWNLEREVSMAMPDFPSGTLPRTHALLLPEAGETSLPRGGRSGVFTTTLGPMLVSSRPILRSNNEGPVRGTLIMGRFVDEALLRELTERTQVVFRWWPIQGGYLPWKERDILLTIPPDAAPLLRETDSRHLAAYAVVPDIQGVPAILLRAEIPREMTIRGHATIWAAMTSTLAGGATVILVLGLLLSRAVLHPIKRLTAHADHIMRTDDLSARIQVAQKDEIGVLARTFDLMVERLQGQTATLREMNQELQNQIAVRLEAETALRESEERFRVMAVTATDPIVILDHEGCIVYWNPAAEKVFGYTGDEAMGREARFIVSPRDCEAYRQGFHRFKEAGKDGATGNRFELKGLRKDGTEFPVELSVSAFHLKGLWYAMGIARDISERRQAEQERLKRERLQGVLEMAGAVCHELSQPMQGVLGYTELLAADLPADHSLQKDLSRIVRLIIKMGEITKKLMSITHYETREYAGGRKIIDIHRSSTTSW